jgi:hypothetical protein
MPTSAKSEIDITAAILSRLSPRQLFSRLRCEPGGDGVGNRNLKRCAASALGRKWPASSFFAGNSLHDRFKSWITTQQIEEWIDFDKIKVSCASLLSCFFPTNSKTDLFLRARDESGQMRKAAHNGA